MGEPNEIINVTPENFLQNANSSVEVMLSSIRPYWKSKRLIERVEKLLPIDPSSACQRLLNAAIHDLRDKIKIAGIDIASEAAEQNRLPSIKNNDDVDNLDTTKVIYLSYYMGLLNRKEWRKLLRSYDIRKDLEHEDDQYEAEIEDCIYIFKTSIDIVLSRDPIEILQLNDIMGLIDVPEPITISKSIIEDYSHTPEPRQSQIFGYLINKALNAESSDIIRQNAYILLGSLKDHTKRNVIIKYAENMTNKIGRNTPSLLQIKVSYCANLLPYLKNRQKHQYFMTLSNEMKRISFRWQSYEKHGDFLQNLIEVGGLLYCPDELHYEFIEWLVLCYIGEKGGYGYYGSNRKVFYSDTGASLAYSILQDFSTKLKSYLQDLVDNNDTIKEVITDKNVARRFEDIFDLAENSVTA